MLTTQRQTRARILLYALAISVAVVGLLYTLLASGAEASPSASHGWTDCSQALYIANEGNGGGGTTVSKVDCHGNISVFATGFFGASGLATDGSYLFVSDDAPGVYRIDVSGNVLQVAGS